MRFFLKISSLFLFTFLVACGGSKKLSKTDNSALKKEVELIQPVENALLWEIKGNNLEQPSYLFGTIHLIDGDDFFWPKGTLTALEKCNVVTYEIDMSEMQGIGAQMSMLKDAFMKDNTELKDLVTEEDYSMLKAHFEKMGLPIFLFERIKPMFLTVFASPDMDPNKLKSGEMKSYEMEILEIADSQEKKSAGLETIEFQISVFDSIPYKDQADMLVESVKSAEEGANQFKEMVQIYKDQNLSGMEKLMSEGELEDDAFEDLLLKNRNLRWIPLMQDMMSTEPHFFAVGAGHLGGIYGVVNLLRDKGFTVTPISI